MLQAYGGNDSFTGPTLGGCALTATTLTIQFDVTMLRGDKVVMQKYGTPNFTPYYHGHGNPNFHGGSQLFVQTKASSFCIETMHLNESNHSSPVYCPTWVSAWVRVTVDPSFTAESRVTCKLHVICSLLVYFDS